MSQITTVTGVLRRDDRQSLILSGHGQSVTVEQVRAFQEASTAPATRRGYDTHWRNFTTWCEQGGVSALPAEPFTVASYLSAAAVLTTAAGEWAYTPGTIRKWLSSINKAHELAGFPKPGSDPEVSLTLAGIARERAQPERRMRPLLLDGLKRVLRSIDMHSWPHGVIGHRDAALLTIGFAGAFRRSELAALEPRDMTYHPEDGFHAKVRTSKTDQEGQGSIKGLPFGANPLTCPPCAYLRWVRVLEASQLGRPATMSALRASNLNVHICQQDTVVTITGSVFRPVMKNGAVEDRAISGNVVNDVVKRRVGALGVDPGEYGGHSLRAGFVTQALRAGASHHEIMRQTGQKKADTVEVYSRENDPLQHNAVTRVGL